MNVIDLFVKLNEIAERYSSLDYYYGDMSYDEYKEQKQQLLNEFASDFDEMLSDLGYTKKEKQNEIS